MAFTQKHFYCLADVRLVGPPQDFSAGMPAHDGITAIQRSQRTQGVQVSAQALHLIRGRVQAQTNGRL